MRHLNTISRVFAGVTAVALLVACSGSPAAQIDGNEVVNSEEVITTADGLFTDHLANVGADGAVTSSEDSRCYYQPEGESDNVATELFCGPVRVLGVDDAHWLPLAATSGTGEDGVSLDVSESTFGEPTSVDAQQLFRPDEAEPVAVDSLAEPEAPAAPVSDFAVLPEAGDTMLEADFEALSEPYVLRAPAMTITVEETAEVSELTADVVDLAGGDSGATSGDADPGSDDGDEADASDDADGAEGSDANDSDLYSSSFFRPAEGQTARAWRLSVSAPAGAAGDPEADWFAPDPDGEQHDATGSVVVAVGSEQIDVVGGPRTDEGAAGVACESGQCDAEDATGEYVLVTSSSGEEAPELVVTTDDVEQTLSLADGTATTPMSTVADSREQLSAEVSTTWDPQEVTVATQDQLNDEVTDWAWGSDLTFTFGGGIDEAHLAPFDPSQGWAEQGKAWLVVPVVEDPRALVADFDLTDGGPGAMSFDPPPWSLQSGEQAIPGEAFFPQGEDEAASAQRVVFEVDDTFTEGEITYHPTGSVDFSNGVSYPLETEALTAEVTVPE